MKTSVLRVDGRLVRIEDATDVGIRQLTAVRKVMAVAWAETEEMKQLWGDRALQRAQFMFGLLPAPGYSPSAVFHLMAVASLDGEPIGAVAAVPTHPIDVRLQDSDSPLHSRINDFVRAHEPHWPFVAIGPLAVAAPFRRHGVATFLLRHISEASRVRYGRRNCWLHTRPHLVSMCRDAGFQELERDMSPLGTVTVFMVRPGHH